MEDRLCGPNALRMMDHFDGVGRHGLVWLWVLPSACVQRDMVVEVAGPAPGILSVQVVSKGVAWWLGAVVMVVVVAESTPWVLCAQAECGEVVWQGTCTLEMVVVVFVPARCQWALMSSAQLNDVIVMDAMLLLGVSIMVGVFFVSPMPSLLTFCMPLLAIGFMTQSSVGTMLGLGSVGWWLTMGDHVGEVVAKLPGTVCTFLVPPPFTLLTSCGPLLVAVGDAALADCDVTMTSLTSPGVCCSFKSLLVSLLSHSFLLLFSLSSIFPLCTLAGGPLSLVGSGFSSGWQLRWWNNHIVLKRG